MNNTAQLTIWGGAGEHGRSCFYLHNEPIRVLLDCGAKKTGTGEYPLLPADTIPSLAAVFLSHAHEDHSMAIPLLYKLGYQGKVWGTRATMEKLPLYFSAWAHYVDSQSGTLPYSSQHLQQIQYACLEDATAPGEWTELSPGLRICWGKSGHILGSIWLLLDLNGKIIFFSGDFTNEGRLLAADWPPSLRGKSLDLAIVEAAYALDAEDQATKLSHLEAATQKVLTNNGWMLLPVPVVGRGQDLLVWASETFPAARLLVETNVAYGLNQLLQWSHWLRPAAAAVINRVLKNPQLVIIKNTQHREQAVTHRHGGIILTSDAILQTDTARWYYHMLQNHPSSAVVFTGHLPPGSYGHQILATAHNTAECTAELIYYKVHQGIADLQQMLKQLPSRHTVLVHAGKQATDSVCALLASESKGCLHSLAIGESLRF